MESTIDFCLSVSGSKPLLQNTGLTVPASMTMQLQACSRQDNNQPVTPGTDQRKERAVLRVRDRF